MTMHTRSLTPVSCENLRALLSTQSGVAEELGVERLGAFRGHLRLCNHCRAIYGARLEELVMQALAVKTVRGLGPTMSESVQQTLVARMTDNDLCVRMAAVEALGSLGQAMAPSVQQALVARLGDQAWTVRMVAGQALAQLGNAMPASVQRVLVACLEDPDESVREAAVSALGTLREAMPEFVRHALEARLTDEDEMVRQAAEEALPVEMASVASVAPTASESETFLQPLSATFQRLVALTRDVLWSVFPAPQLAHSMNASTLPVLDEEGATGIKAGASVALTEKEHVHAGPRLTGSGRFQLVLHGPDARFVGKDLCCDLQLIEGQKISFRTPIRASSDASGWEAKFDELLLTDASLYSQQDYRIPFGPDYLRFIVRPSHH